MLGGRTEEWQNEVFGLSSFLFRCVMTPALVSPASFSLVTPYAMCWRMEGSTRNANIVCLIPIRAN